MTLDARSEPSNSSTLAPEAQILPLNEPMMEVPCITTERVEPGAPLLPDDRVLLEVKLPGVCPLWLAHALAEAGAVPVSFSKYGSCYCHHLLRELPVPLKEVFPCA